MDLLQYRWNYVHSWSCCQEKTSSELKTQGTPATSFLKTRNCHITLSCERCSCKTSRCCRDKSRYIRTYLVFIIFEIRWWKWIRPIANNNSRVVKYNNIRCFRPITLWTRLVCEIWFRQKTMDLLTLWKEYWFKVMVFIELIIYNWNKFI